MCNIPNNLNPNISPTIPYTYAVWQHQSNHTDEYLSRLFPQKI